MIRPILFVGDIHLGRTPRRLGVGELTPSKLGPAEAWQRVVQAALDENAQAVVLAGDVVDQDKDRFEAWGILYSGVSDLVEAGVRVFGVAGNHDHVALPRLADRIPAFHLLGPAGCWERVELDGVDLIGWSFPKQHHTESPLVAPGLAAALEGRRPDCAAIGVLHGDLDAGASKYAPVSRQRLMDLELDGVFLGHIHQPSSLGGFERPVGYLGSLVGLDRSETGPRGPWLVSTDGPGSLRARQLPLGPVYWTEVEVDVSGILPADDAIDLLIGRVQTAVSGAIAADTWVQSGDFLAVGVSVVCVGALSVPTLVSELAQQEDKTFWSNDVACPVVKVIDRTRTAIDLAVLAEQQTPLGRLARLLQSLEAGHESAIPDSVRAAMTTHSGQAWGVDEEHPPVSVLEMTRRAARKLVEELHAQGAQAERG